MTVSSSDLKGRAACIGAPQKLTLRSDANGSRLNGSEDQIRPQLTGRDHDMTGGITLIRGEPVPLRMARRRSLHGACHALVK